MIYQGQFCAIYPFTLINKKNNGENQDKLVCLHC